MAPKVAISHNGWFMKNSFLGLFLLAFASSAFAQAPAARPAGAQSGRSEMYYHFSLARQLDEEGLWTQAVDEYKKALELDSNNSLIYAEMADTYRRNNRVREAIEAAQKAVQLNRDN